MIPSDTATKGTGPALSAAPVFLFHWVVEGVTSPEWINTLRDIANKSGCLITPAVGVDRVSMVLDESTLEFRVSVSSGKVRGSIIAGKGCWKAALVLLCLGRHFTVSLVDDDSNVVTVRSLKKQTHLGFTEVEYGDFAEQLGLINRTMANDPMFAQFF